MRMQRFTALRGNLRIVTWLNVIILVNIFLQIYDVTTQLNDHALMNWAVTRSELSGSTTPPTRIPKIIHQTYKTAEIPEKWREAHDSVRAQNPDYQYILWTDEMARKFIATNYPWFLKTFDTYKYPIMRADAIRYFILYHYGGFYIDMDIGLKTSLDELRQLPTVFYKTDPTGVSNDFMGCSPQHPFMSYVVSKIKGYRGNYWIPYFTVMYGTGSLFVSVLLQRYNLWATRTGDAATRVFMLHADPSSKYKPLADYLYHVQGLTWHQGDASLFAFINDHLLVSIIAICLLGCAALVTVFWLELKIVLLVQRFFQKKPAVVAPFDDHFKQA